MCLFLESIVLQSSNKFSHFLGLRLGKELNQFFVSRSLWEGIKERIIIELVANRVDQFLSVLLQEATSNKLGHSSIDFHAKVGCKVEHEGSPIVLGKVS